MADFLKINNKKKSCRVIIGNKNALHLERHNSINFVENKDMACRIIRGP